MEKDDGEWDLLKEKVDEDGYIDVTVRVDEDIKSWIQNNNIKLDELLNKLLSSYYQTDRLIHKE